MSRTSAVIRNPTRMRAGAVAWAGTMPASGAKKRARRKHTPVTTEASPDRERESPRSRPGVHDHGEDGGGDDAEQEPARHAPGLEPEHQEQTEERHGHGRRCQRTQGHGNAGGAGLDDARGIEPDEKNEE